MFKQFVDASEVIAIMEGTRTTSFLPFIPNPMVKYHTDFINSQDVKLTLMTNGYERPLTFAPSSSGTNLLD